jgi:hypothetical protein
MSQNTAVITTLMVAKIKLLILIYIISRIRN